MNEQRLKAERSRLAQAASPRVRPVGSALIAQGQVSSRDMLTALAKAARDDAPLDRVLLAEALATPQDVLAAQARHLGVGCVDPIRMPPDPGLQDLLSPTFCLRHAVLPWVRVGQTTVLATARPDSFADLRSRLPSDFGPVVMTLALEDDLQALITARHGAALASVAETSVPDDESCRDINRLTLGRGLAAGTFAGLCLATLAMSPSLFFGAVVAVAILSLVLAQGLKVAAFLASRPAVAPSPDTLPAPSAAPDARPRPTVSLLVPLYREQDIASTLVARLNRLSYPKALLDVVLVLEAEDGLTRAAIDRAARPPWMRVVEVPKGAITTKPRALNYALAFCRGDIVGIYDAEDAPAANQIDRIVERFSSAPDRVACIQGILDFYNPRANWLSRCFAIEYATWFRIVLPGLARLGFAVPLGGTTVFFRRAALESVCGWDAHNVTEDADLGIRLARHGYVTELLPTVTREEANNRTWPWIKQRSRWLKGYMVTYAVHMRNPARLMRDLGWWKFIGFQMLFLTAILQFLLAPALWSFWLVLFGMPHPLSALLSHSQMTAIVTIFLVSEAVSLVVSVAAVARSPHSGLLLWVPTLMLYFPLGVIAIYKGLYELLAKPFYWDKTAHGHSLPDHAAADRSED